jgi:hypothetical protein
MAFSTSPDDYLNFTATDMVEALKLKLSEDSRYTDLVYEGSNISVLIDIFAFIFEAQIFQMNHNAAESVPANASFYENINRLVKFLGYNPKGFVTPSCLTKMALDSNLTSTGIYALPKYTTVETSLTDSAGLPVKYTFIDTFSFIATVVDDIDSTFTPLLYNGIWKMYPQIFTSAGGASESYTLEDLELDGDDRVYISHQHFSVHVLRNDDEYYEFTPTTSLYNSSVTDKHFESRINENKRYVLTFGDGVNGARLNSGDRLYIVYLQSNGTDGQIGSNAINVDLELTVEIDGMGEDFLKDNILKIDDNPRYIGFGTDPAEQLSKIRLYNDETASFASDLEDADAIKANAPNSFRMGNRLITPQDFEQYILATYLNEIYDIQVFNNWSYMTKFQKWAYDHGVLSPDLAHYNFAYSDSCDFNNVYLIMKSFSNNMVPNSAKTMIIQDCDRIKCLTSELIPMDPLLTYFTPYIRGTYDYSDFDADNENKIVITRDKNSFVTVERIKQNVVNAIQTFFSIEENKLGQIIQVDNLYNTLSTIDGVKSVRTKYLADGDVETNALYYDGLSFGLWTIELLKGADFTNITGRYELKEFQFPILLDSDDIGDKIEVTNEGSLAIPEY